MFIKNIPWFLALLACGLFGALVPGLCFIFNDTHTSLKRFYFYSFIGFILGAGEFYLLTFNFIK